MKNFFKELFEYNHYYNTALVKAFEENKNKLSDKSIQLINHIFNAHHNWNNRIFPHQSQFKVWSIHPAEEYSTINKTNFELSNTIIDTFDLDQSIQYTNSGGQAFENKIREILFMLLITLLITGPR